MKMRHGDYTTGERIRQCLIAILIVANLIIWGGGIYRELTKPEPVMGVDYFPFANQNIEWYYAGKGWDW